MCIKISIVMKQLISYVCAPIRKCTWCAWVMGAMVLSATLSAQGLPDFNFSRSIRDSLGPGIFQNARGIAIDANSIYVTGYFEGTVNFGVDIQGNAVVRSSVGMRNVFVASLNKAGQIKWIQTFGGERTEGADIEIWGGTLYVTGYFMDLMFSVSQPQYVIKAHGFSDIFVVAMDPDSGSIVWLQQGNVLGQGEGIGIAANTYGVYVAGYFTDSIIFPHISTSTPVHSYGAEDVCVLQFNAATGQYIWGGHIGGQGSDKGYAILPYGGDNFGGFWITGFFEDSCGLTFEEDYNEPPVYVRSRGGRDAFVIQYQLHSGKKGYVIASQGKDRRVCLVQGPWDDEGRDIFLDNVAGVYVTGFFDRFATVHGFNDSDSVHVPAIVDAPPPPLLTAPLIGSLSSVGGIDAFQLVWTFSSASQSYDIWLGTMGGEGNDKGTAIIKGGSGNLYTVGIFEEQADVDPQPSRSRFLSSTGGTDIFVIVQDSLQSQNGPYLVGVGQMGGEGYDSCGAIATYAAADTVGWYSVWNSVCSTYVQRPLLAYHTNELAFAGFYQDVGDFNPHLYQDSFLPVSIYGWEGFVTHLMGRAGSPSPPVIMGLTPHENEKSDGVYVVNPIEGDVLKIFLPQESGPSRVMIYSVTGKLMASHFIDGAGLTEIHLPFALPSGAYIIKVLDREGGIIEHATVQKW